MWGFRESGWEAPPPAVYYPYFFLNSLRISR